ncbi:TetR/AcrR family transcriptional regulator [Paenibacillus filicis]|uniref:TetR/AcrR family transcriptional regulator n=1 Tax=Paenibacillus gyeongsangnamensis TaxID=3388067 RepID=A0ABT4QCA5_9BACL|nr:TetR/AcrR family transcriptional regulator [Paenibacillus filicis]MCZ8514496.1 TetR/AcrR family transcriptional regulator [Paenibacillus filicis]
MPGKQELRSEETRKAILQAAGDLFATRGFDAVTMREIAKAAGCSHTTIYIYYKDKEALLHQLSMPPLRELQERFERTLGAAGHPDGQLQEVSLSFIRFCLANRNMHHLFFMTGSERVDAASPRSELNALRNALFGLLQHAVGRSLGLAAEDPRLLAFSRIYFYMLHGIVGTYASSEEPPQTLLERLTPTFEEAVDVMLCGFKERLNR